MSLPEQIQVLCEKKEAVEATAKKCRDRKESEELDSLSGNTTSLQKIHDMGYRSVNEYKSVIEWKKEKNLLRTKIKETLGLIDWYDTGRFREAKGLRFRPKPNYIQQCERFMEKMITIETKDNDMITSGTNLREFYQHNKTNLRVCVTVLTQYLDQVKGLIEGAHKKHNQGMIDNYNTQTNRHLCPSCHHSYTPCNTSQHNKQYDEITQHYPVDMVSIIIQYIGFPRREKEKWSASNEPCTLIKAHVLPSNNEQYGIYSWKWKKQNTGHNAYISRCGQLIQVVACTQTNYLTEMSLHATTPRMEPEVLVDSWNFDSNKSDSESDSD